MSETEINRIIQKMDSFEEKINTILNEVRNKDITCLRNQTACQTSIAKEYIKIDEFQAYFNKAIEQYHENNAKKLSRVRKVMDDLLAIFKWVVIIVGSGIGIKFFNVLGR